MLFSYVPFGVTVMVLGCPDYLQWVPFPKWIWTISDWFYLYSATSVNVEHVFSKGQILLSHIQNRLLAQSVHALMCLGSWSRLGFVKDTDVLTVTILPEVDGDDKLEEGRDRIHM